MCVPVMDCVLVCSIDCSTHCTSAARHTVKIEHGRSGRDKFGIFVLALPRASQELVGGAARRLRMRVSETDFSWRFWSNVLFAVSVKTRE